MKGINLKDVIQTEQLDFRQEKADDSNTMHNSKFRPNNDMEIHWGRFGVACSITPTQTQTRCNSLLRKQKELNLEK